MLALITALLIAYCFSSIAGFGKKEECISLTKKYKADKPFTTCINLYAGHDLYFAQGCPTPGPRLCIEPIPEGVNFHVMSKEHQLRTDEALTSPDDSIIPFANMTRIKGRINEKSPDPKFPMDCLWCWNYTYQSKMWSEYVDTIEKTVGFKFSNSSVRTLIEFGCGSGGFLGEMAVRGVTGICTAKEFPSGDGSESYLPYLRTVAARGLLAMHLSVMSHQPFLSYSFNFIHCSWVLAYVTPTQRMYSQIFIEWDRLLTPGGLVVQQGAWFKRKGNAEMLELFSYTKYLLEVVLQWKLIEWKIYEDNFLGGKAVMNFIATKPLSRVSKDWSADPTLLKLCPGCFKDPDLHGGGGGDGIGIGKGRHGHKKDLVKE